MILRGHTSIPVVDRDSHRLEGIISSWDALRVLLEGNPSMHGSEEVASAGSMWLAALLLRARLRGDHRASA